MQIDLTGNIKTIGPVFFTGTRSKQHSRRLVQRLISVETAHPHRRGSGWGVLLAPGLVVGLGVWRPDPAPNLTTEAREAQEHANRIPRWHHMATLTLEDEVPPARRGLPEGWSIIPMES